MAPWIAAPWPPCYRRRVLARRVAAACAVLWWCLAVTPLRAAPARPTPAQLEKMRRSLESPSAKIRIKAAQVLARSGAPDRAAAIATLLDDDDAAVRAAACDALVVAADRAAVTALREAAADPSELVAARARVALGALEHAVHLAAKAGVNGGEPAVLAAMAESGREALAGPRRLVPSAEGAQFTVSLVLQSVVVKPGTGSTVVEVAVTGMVLEQPGSRLRFSSRATVAASQEGTVSAKEVAELTRDAAAAAARACAADAAGWLQALPVGPLR
ncbi:MAG: HEAT repeat domain-containing protein [Deltaproteobacteria bacterium]|nr:HEAT repeat domain-containing protein [Deltaproteobacteria bacterium]